MYRPYPKPGKKIKKATSIPKKIVEEVFKRDLNICQYCGIRTAGLDEDSGLIQAHCHHIIHKSQCGKDVKNMLNTACWQCHALHGSITRVDKRWLKGEDIFRSGRMYGR